MTLSFGMPHPEGRGGIRGYRRLQTGLLSILILYAAIGVAADRLRIPETRIFPIFSWSLFSRVPGPYVHDYALRIIAVNGAALDAPLYYQDCGEWFAKTRNSTAYALTQRLGRALAADDGPRASRLHRMVETFALHGPRSVRYEVVERRSHILGARRRADVSILRTWGVFEVSRE